MQRGVCGDGHSVAVVSPDGPTVLADDETRRLVRLRVRRELSQGVGHRKQGRQVVPRTYFIHWHTKARGQALAIEYFLGGRVRRYTMLEVTAYQALYYTSLHVDRLCLSRGGKSSDRSVP